MIPTLISMVDHSRILGSFSLFIVAVYTATSRAMDAAQTLNHFMSEFSFMSWWIKYLQRSK